MLMLSKTNSPIAGIKPFNRNNAGWQQPRRGLSQNEGEEQNSSDREDQAMAQSKLLKKALPSNIGRTTTVQTARTSTGLIKWQQAFCKHTTVSSETQQTKTLEIRALGKCINKCSWHEPCIDWDEPTMMRNTKGRDIENKANPGRASMISQPFLDKDLTHSWIRIVASSLGKTVY